MIPYNPSSFNTNKTILEQILELKNWLKEHPSYRIFEVNANFDPLNNEYQLSAVYDEDGVMNTGDVVLFLNSYVASVQSVDRDNGTFLTWDGINIKGPQGSTGPRGPQGLTGATGPQGVSITNATIDSSDHLIVTLSNGSTIDAGLVVDGTKAYIIQLTSYAGTLTADDLAIVNDPSKLCVIDYYVNSKHSFYFKDRQITDGWRFSNLDYVEGSQITIIQYFEIDSATGSYAQDLTQTFIRAENINSYNATSGKVLTANGSGGCSWENAGGSTLYEHNILLYWLSGNNEVNGLIKIITNSNTALTISELQNKINANGFNSATNYMICNGYGFANNVLGLLFGLFVSGSNYVFKYILTNGTLGQFTISRTEITITDTVVTL